MGVWPPCRRPSSACCLRRPRPMAKGLHRAQNVPQASPCADGASGNDGGQVSTGTGYGWPRHSGGDGAESSGLGHPTNDDPGPEVLTRGTRRFWRPLPQGRVCVLAASGRLGHAPGSRCALQGSGARAGEAWAPGHGHAQKAGGSRRAGRCLEPGALCPPGHTPGSLQPSGSPPFPTRVPLPTRCCDVHPVSRTAVLRACLQAKSWT